MGKVIFAALFAVAALASDSSAQCVNGQCQMPTRAPVLPQVMRSVIEQQPIRTVIIRPTVTIGRYVWDKVTPPYPAIPRTVYRHYNFAPVYRHTNRPPCW